MLVYQINKNLGSILIERLKTDKKTKFSYKKCNLNNCNICIETFKMYAFQNVINFNNKTFNIKIN